MALEDCGSLRFRIAGTLLSVLLATALGFGRASPGLPLGPRGLPESHTFRILAPGVTWRRYVRGRPSPRDHWTVDVDFTPSRARAAREARGLRRRRVAVQVLPIRPHPMDAPARGPLGFLVRAGRFTTKAAACRLRNWLAGRGYPRLPKKGNGRLEYTGEDGGATTGPWVVNVLEVDPARFAGTVQAALATDVVPGVERVSRLARRRGALAGTNGSYFVTSPRDGTVGDLAGLSMIDGQVVSEAADDRTCLLLPATPGGVPVVAALTTHMGLRAQDGAVRELDGRNRINVLVRTGGPSEKPKHDVTRHHADEIVQFTPVFGAATPPGGREEAALDAAGKVLAVRTEGGSPIPAGGSVLSGTGTAVEWLLRHAPVGSTVKVTVVVSVAEPRGPDRDTALRLVEGDPHLDMVSGGPRLLRGGRMDVPAAREGFAWGPAFFYYFGVRRHPRTLAGVTAHGRLLLVTVDGSRPGYSVGASFQESARLMRALGAVDAVNLDGGGSTTMCVDGRLVSRPSDPGGERRVGDAVLIMKPRGR